MQAEHDPRGSVAIEVDDAVVEAAEGGAGDKRDVRDVRWFSCRTMASLPYATLGWAGISGCSTITEAG